MYDAGLVPFAEPFAKLMNQGMLLAHTPHRTMEAGETMDEEADKDETERDLIALTPEQAEKLPPEKIIWKWVKMSKSKRNVVTPDAMAAKYGADALRTYELFVAPFEDAVQWSEEGMNGAFRFMGRVWRLVNDWSDRFDPDWRNVILNPADVILNSIQDPRAKALRRKTHQTIRKVGEDIEGFAFNTAVAALMELVNEMHAFAASETQHPTPITHHPAMDEAVETLILLLSPMTPHIADELWETLGKKGFTLEQPWPEYDAEVAKADEVEIVAQINGKVRDRMVVPADADEEALRTAALSSERIKSDLEGKTVRKVIVVKGKLVNIVVI
jgi:leucyl-tRNA synthetase